jgi:amylosucrase
MLHAYMFTLSGIPVIYSGDEVAQENDYSYHDDPLKAVDSRYLHRGNMNWRAAAQRSKKKTAEGIIFRSIRELEDIRRAHRVFDAAADTWIIPTGDINVLGIGRFEQGEKLIAFFNFADEERSVRFTEEGEFTDLSSGMAAEGNTVRIESGSFVWLLCDFNKEG